MRAHISPSLSAEIKEKFSLGEDFLKAYKFPDSGRLQDVLSVEELYGDNDMSRIYLSFAFSNIIRGRQVRDYLLPMLGPTPDGGRYLDVGTAYGGFLVAFAEAGYETVGIEIDPYWASLGKANCRDHNIPDCIRVEDFLKIDLESLGQFDFITCNDVIEHVLDPTEAIRRISSLLKPGGKAFFEVPNRRAITAVTKDGHYGAFGVCLLRHFDAAQFLKETTGLDVYTCGEMYSSDWYLNTMSRMDLSGSLIRSTPVGEFDDIPVLLHALSNGYSYWNSAISKTNSPLMVELLKQNYAKFNLDLYKSYYDALSTGDQVRFCREYLSGFWSFLVQKSR